MSYREISNCPLPNMSKGIISFWFREIEKQQSSPPPAEQWPQGFWTAATAATTMVPPNAQYSVSVDPDFADNVIWWNSYGLPPTGIGGLIFGDAFLSAAAVWIPNSPPIPQNTWSGSNAQGGVADVDMSQFGIRTLLVFGDPDIDYQYCEWRKEEPSVIEAVQYIPNLGIGPEFVAPDWPPPYIPWLLKDPKTGLPLPNGGKFKPAFYSLDPPTSKFKLAPSFIGIDNDGHLVINLQTNTKATYKGMAFAQTKIKELWAALTYLKVRGPPYTYSQIGFPFPDGDWISTSGYWNGYQFEYKDVSQEVMGGAPESFVIFASNVGVFDFAFNAPKVKDGGWHHVLFSFDISGSVTTDLTTPDAPSISTNCQAWLAFDDTNITGSDLQNRPPVHDGFLLPKLRGTETIQLLDCGPTATYSRQGSGLGPNDILPRNAWLHGWGGNPKDSGLLWYAANATLITADDDIKNKTARLWGGKVGDFNWMEWTGSIWTLYGHGVAPGPWQATFNPMHPDPTFDPKTTFEAPSYNASGFSIPCSGNPIGIPCSSNMIANNTGVEMAELQIWADQTLDTGIKANRRLFIDDKSKPVKVKIAEKKLGKPDILLHGSSNWKKGKNTGSTGVDKQGQTIDSGQFDVIGTAEKFEPEPEIGK